MSSGIYGGDDVGAVIFDFGKHSFRTGFAGDDQPRADVPSTIGVVDPLFNGGRHKRHVMGIQELAFPRQSVDMNNYIDDDGLIDDWDLFDRMLDFIYSDHLCTESKQHPVLISEPSWNDSYRRQKLAEFMFEAHSVPSMYLVKSAVLTAFSNGRRTSLIVDSGAAQTSVTPVIDGFVIKEAVTRSSLAGELLTARCRQYLDQEKINLLPGYRILKKERVLKGCPPRFTEKTPGRELPSLGVSPQWHNYQVKQLVQDFKSVMLEASSMYGTLTEDQAADVVLYPKKEYEFPTGYKRDFGFKRFQLPEFLFDSAAGEPYQGFPENNRSVIDLILSTISKCDTDYRKQLLECITLTGGTTLLNGYQTRLLNDVTARSSLRLKIPITNTPIELRRFQPWIGGSIMASLGTFQQMWISKNDYEEEGKRVVDMRCR